MASRAGAPPSGPRRLAVYNEAVTLEDLSRGRTRLAMIRDCALNELSDRELAMQIGCDVATVKAFRAVYATEIAETIAALAGNLAIETAGLWVSHKKNRVAMLQSSIETLDKAMRFFEDQGPIFVASREYDRLQRALAFALSQVQSEYAAADKRNGDSEVRTARYILEMTDDIAEAMR